MGTHTQCTSLLHPLARDALSQSHNGIATVMVAGHDRGFRMALNAVGTRCSSLCRELPPSAPGDLVAQSIT